MDFDFDTEERAFRDEVRAFIAENHPGTDRPTDDVLERWHRKLIEKRWIGFA